MKLGYDNMGDFWLLRYESDTFREEVSRLWETVKPLYEELHAYVRFRLSQKYSQVSTDAPLPAHVLGTLMIIVFTIFRRIPYLFWFTTQETCGPKLGKTSTTRCYHIPDFPHST